MNSIDLTIKYKPKKIEEVLLPSNLRSKLTVCFNEALPYPYLFYGQSGVGKTLTAQLIRQESYFVSCLNGCSDLDMYKLEQSISSVTLNGERRMVILDDVDHMSPNNQLLLKSILDRFSANNDFILTAIEPFRLKETIRSRVQIIEFELEKSADFIKSLIQWLINIAELEGVPNIDEIDVLKLISKTYPDIRLLLRNFQHNFIM